MKALLKHVGHADAATEGALKVIDRFDQLMVGGASLDRLLLTAAAVSGRTVSIEDTWSDRRLRVVSGGMRQIEAWDEEGLAVLRAAIEKRLRGHRAVLLKTAFGEVVAASIEAATGRAGTVWLESGSGAWSTIDHLIAERLAAAVTMLILRPQEAASFDTKAAALELLLAGPSSAAEIPVLAKKAHLDPEGHYVAVALETIPPSAVGAEVLASAAARAFDGAGRALPVVAGSAAFLVTKPHPGYEDVLAELTRAEERVFRIRVGVGDSGPVCDLHRSATQAREALALGPLVNGQFEPTRFSELGALHVLAQIPPDDVEGFTDVANVASLDDRGPGVSDLRILETYCATNSLRQTASRLHLHHSTINYRRKRIEETLGFSLVEPGQRLRALLAVKLFQIARLRQQ